MKLKTITTILFLMIFMSSVSQAQHYSYSDQYLNVTIELKEINSDSISASILVDLVNKPDSIFIVPPDPESFEAYNSSLSLSLGLDLNRTANTNLDLGKIIHKNDSVRYEFKTAKPPNSKIEDAYFQINYLLCKDFLKKNKGRTTNSHDDKYSVTTTDYFIKMHWLEFRLPICGL